MQTEQVLWKLFRLKNSMEENEKVADKLRIDLENSRKKDSSAEEEVQSSKRELARLTKLLNTVEKEAGGKEKQLSNVVPRLMEVRDKQKRTNKRVQASSLSIVYYLISILDVFFLHEIDRNSEKAKRILKRTLKVRVRI